MSSLIEAAIERLRACGLLDLAEEIAARHHVTLDEVLGRSRARPETNARFELCTRLYQRLHSYPRVGELVGRDHSTVIEAVRQHRARRGTFPVDEATKNLDRLFCARRSR